MPLLPKLRSRLDEAARDVAFSGSTFIAARPEGSVHWTVTFLDDRRYPHTGRAAAREV
jgi:hypothetical protein